MAAPLTSAAAASGGAHRLDNRFVLETRGLRPGCTLEQTARFRDDIWRLEPADLQRHAQSLTLDFATVPAAWRSLTKELCYAMLSGTLPPREERPRISTVRGNFIGVRRFLTWLENRPAAATGRPAARLGELVGADLEAYQRHLLTVFPQPDTRGLARSKVRLLWRYREVMPDHLGFDPWHCDGWTKDVNKVAAENATPRIPEQVHGPLMVWAMRFVDEFSADILAAADDWRATRAALKSSQLIHRNTGAADDLHALLHEHIVNHLPLPGFRSRPNMSALARTTGCCRQTVQRHRDEIYAAADIVGLDDTQGDLPITGRIDDQPWIDAISVEPGSFRNLGTLTNMLLAAAYAAIAFQSGMRDSEIKHLRRCCLTTHRDQDGRPYRYKVTSLAFKGEHDPSGVEATWVVGAPAARAIGVLERLQPPGTELLFFPLEFGGGGAANRTNDLVLESKTTNRQLNSFLAWINHYCAAHNRPDGIPAVNGRVWHLSTRQWRRTLAWYIARHPGGSIAGAIAFRHLSIQMFEGYAGTSDSGFRAEVESEQALARGEHLMAMIDQHEHTDLAGPAADEAVRRLEDFGDQARFRGTVITDERRLQRLMDRHDPAIYPGKYITCVHTHATALCQQRRDHHNLLRPDLGTCRPLSCRNTALTPDNITNLRTEITDIDRELDTRPPLPPLIQHQLRTRRNDIQAFLDRHAPE